MIIELVGLPGSGKTLAAKRSLDLLASRGVPCVGFEEIDRFQTKRGDRYLNRCNFFVRLYHFATLYRRHPATVLRVLWLTLLHGALRRKRWRKARRPLSMLHMSKRLAQEFPGRLVILHDGFLQKLWSMLVESGDLRGITHIEALMTDYYSCTGVRCILLEIPEETSIERVFARQSKGRFNRNASADRRAAFGKWLGYHRALSALLPQASVLAKVDASATPEQVAEQVAGVARRAQSP